MSGASPRARRARLCVTVLAVALLGWAGADRSEAADRPVKKSKSGICHCPGAAYYARTARLARYGSIAACLASGGRHPKRGQGDCSKVAAPAAEPAPRASMTAFRIVDGDTLELGGRRVRLHGIDAPEAAQPCRDAEGAAWPCGRRAS